MKRRKCRKRKIKAQLIIYRAAASACIAILIVIFFVWQRAYSAPLLANYYLGTLPTDSASIKKLAGYDLLILSPEQAIVRKDVIAAIKKENPGIIMLAYVPSQSYNQAWGQYPASTLFGDFRVQDGWWLRDIYGSVVSDWPGLKRTNMSKESTDYLINFVKTKILSSGVWDGVFWDMVDDGISGSDGGNVDLNGDGIRDIPSIANADWVNRIDYLLQQSQNLGTKYIVINGSSIPSMQQYVNGRMYENFPTPWEKNGSWSALMSGLERNRAQNEQPYMYVFNANTNNTGKSDSYRKMRFGITSSLLVNNVYFSFDHGTENHAQIWWYDEYDVKLGDPIGAAQSENNYPDFKEDVWRRDYSNGLAIVNATNESQTVDLGGDYEKITGKQDPSVNDGSIVSQVTLGARDGLIMLKTFQTAKNIFYANGDFMRFYDMSGNRARNGFFAFDDAYPGGAGIFYGDLNGDGQDEKIVTDGPRLKIFNSRGEIWFDGFPFGGDYKGRLQLALGKGSQGQYILAVSGDSGGEVAIYTYYGAVVKNDIYPLGKKYTKGFSIAVGGISGENGDIIIATREKQPQVIIYSPGMARVKNKFFVDGKNYSGTVNVSAGDVNGDGSDEIIAGLNSPKGSIVRIFSAGGRTVSQFGAPAGFGNANITVGALDVNYDGVDEVVLMSGG